MESIAEQKAKYQKIINDLKNKPGALFGGYFINKDLEQLNTPGAGYTVDSAGQVNLKNTVIQGGLDPSVLLLSEQEIINHSKKYFDAFKGMPYVFNLGHGMLPQTDPDKVAKLIKFYRGY